MEKMIEQPQPPEGDEATTGTMSPLATVRQYLSTNSAKSTFLRNSGLVVKEPRPNRLLNKIFLLDRVIYLCSRHKSNP